MQLLIDKEGGILYSSPTISSEQTLPCCDHWILPFRCPETGLEFFLNLTTCMINMIKAHQIGGVARVRFMQLPCT